MKLSYSKISTWKSCHRAFYWSYDLGLQPAMPRVELGRGRAIHDSLSEFYKLEPPNRAKEKLLADFEDSMKRQFTELVNLKGGTSPEDEGKFNRELEKGRTMLINYWISRGQDYEFPKTKTEQEFEVNLGLVSFHGVVDALIPDWIIEHKTGSPDIESLFLEDEQSLYYIWALRKLGMSLKGTVYNFILAPTSARGATLRERVERTELELKGVQDEIIQLAGEIDKLPRYPNRRTHCRFCDFRWLCRGERAGADIDYIIETQFIASRRG